MNSAKGSNDDAVVVVDIGSIDLPRFIAFMAASLVPLVFAAVTLAVIVWRQVATEGPPPATPEFFWLCLTMIPLVLLASTYVLPRRVSPSRRAIQVELPEQIVAVALYDDIRLTVTWAIVATMALFALAAAAISIVALTNCNVNTGTCAGVVSHRMAIYGLVSVLVVPLSLLASRVTSGIEFISVGGVADER